MTYVSINGKLIEAEKATIPICNKANFFDYGVYESIKVLNKKAFYPELHVARLFNSAEKIGLKISSTKEEVLDSIIALIEANKIENALLRIILLGETEKEPQLIYIHALGLHFYPKKYYSKGAKVITFKGERYLPEAKTLNMLLNFLALKKAFENKAIEALLVDRKGCITEGTRSNFFAIKDNAIITPPKGTILQGVTKELLEKHIANNMKIKEEEIKLAALKDCEEFFITSTVFGIMPISQIDNIIFKVGKKTKEIIKLFEAHSKN